MTRYAHAIYFIPIKQKFKLYIGILYLPSPSWRRLVVNIIPYNCILSTRCHRLTHSENKASIKGLFQKLQEQVVMI